MKVGQRVMLIANGGLIDEAPPPPIGAVGEITEPLDFDGDYFVLFQDHPCPNGEPDWYIPATFLIPIDDDPPAVLAGSETRELDLVI